MSAASTWLGNSAEVHSLLDGLLFLLRMSDSRDDLDALRVSHSVDLGFEPAEFNLACDKHQETVTLAASVVGLSGATTPLPLYLAEDAAVEDEAGTVVRGLLDVLHSQLYLGLATGIAALQTDAGPTVQAWTRRVLALAGAAEGHRLSPEVALQLVPILVSGDRSRHAVETAARIMLRPHLGDACVRMEAMAGGFASIHEDQTSRLGTETAALGSTFIAGSKISTPSSSARLVIGPISKDLEAELAPGANGYSAVAALRDLFMPTSVRLRISLVVAGGSARLGQSYLGDDFFLVHEVGPSSSTVKTIELA